MLENNLWRAALASQEQKRQSTVCYFLVCFNSIDYVAFLLASLYNFEDTFIIHCDLKAPGKLRKYLKTLSEAYSNIFVIPSQEYSWAGFSHVAVTLSAMRLALEEAAGWTHFVALSEQHLPLKSPSAIAAALAGRKSMIAVRAARGMGGAEGQDMQNRFGAVYRELPGVGCFATGLADRQALLEAVHHGSNWFALQRSHCQYLVGARERGEFAPFESIVHAEETAIQTILAALPEEIEPTDVTLVAAPHLTDNHSLVMTDELFEHGIGSTFLFIRKRQSQLSTRVIKTIKNNNFEHRVFEMGRATAEEPDDLAHPSTFADEIADLLTRELTSADHEVVVQHIDPQRFGSTPQLHLSIGHPLLEPERLFVRIISENLVDFKILIAREREFPAVFPLPFVRDGFLHSTVRSRVYGLAGHEELLPADEQDGGFVSAPSLSVLDAVTDVAKRFLRAAFTYRAANPPTSPAIHPAESSKSEHAMPRSQRLNALAKAVQAKRYLEVGVCEGETFFAVDIDYKVAVDPAFRFDFQSKADASNVFHPVPSDLYFSQRPDRAPFDLIYLDGLHTFEQTLRDFINSLLLSHDKTVWLLDDTIPTNAFAALPSEQECWESREKVGINDWSWMGDVYKVVFFISRMMPFFHFRTYRGHGQTVIWKSDRARETPSTPGFTAADIGAMNYTTMVRLMSEMTMATDEEILAAITRDLGL